MGWGWGWGEEAGHKLEYLQGSSLAWLAQVPKLCKMGRRWPEMRSGLQVAQGVYTTTATAVGGGSQGRCPSGRHLPTREIWRVHFLV